MSYLLTRNILKEKMYDEVKENMFDVIKEKQEKSFICFFMVSGDTLVCFQSVIRQWYGVTGIPRKL